MYVCSLSYLACIAHAPYCPPWSAPLYDIFPHYLINGMIFEGKLPNKMCFEFLYNFERFLALRRIERDRVKNIYWSSCKVAFILARFNETGIFKTVFRKIGYKIS